MGIKSLSCILPLLFVLGLGIGDAWRQHAAAEGPDLATIMAPACAPTSAPTPRATTPEEERLPLL